MSNTLASSRHNLATTRPHTGRHAKGVRALTPFSFRNLQKSETIPENQAANPRPAGFVLSAAAQESVLVLSPAPLASLKPLEPLDIPRRYQAHTCPVFQPQIRSCRSWQHLRDITLTLPSPVDPSTLATIIAHLPRVLPPTFKAATRVHGQPLVKFISSLVSHIPSTIPVLTPRDTALILWALSKLAYPTAPYITTLLLHRAQYLFPQSTGQDLAAFAWSASRLQPVTLPPRFLQGLEAATCVPRRKANSQDFGMLVWALGSLHHRPSKLWVSNTCDAITTLLPTMSGQNLSNILWGLANMPVRPPTPWIDEFLAVTRLQLHAMTNQNLVNIMWALARMGYRSDGVFMDALLQVAYPRLPIFNPQDLANTIWALATLKHRPSQAWMDRFFSASSSRSSQFLPVQLANVMWGVSELGSRPPPRWVEAQVAAAAAYGGEMKPRWVADVLGALVVFEAHLPELMEDLLGEVLHRVSTSQVAVLKRIVRHLDALGFRPTTRWMDSFLLDLSRHTHRLDPELICVLIWTLAKLQQRPSPNTMQRFLTQLAHHVLGKCNHHQLYRVVVGLSRLGVRTRLAAWDDIKAHVLEAEGALEEGQYRRLLAALHAIRGSHVRAGMPPMGNDAGRRRGLDVAAAQLKYVSRK